MACLPRRSGLAAEYSGEPLWRLWIDGRLGLRESGKPRGGCLLSHPVPSRCASKARVCQPRDRCMTFELSFRSVALARRTAKYVQRFGPRCGLQGIFKTWRPTISGNKDALIGVTWSRTSGEAVWLRPSTSDVTVFEQVFVDRNYDVDAFPQITALRGKYEELLSSGKTPVIIDCGANIGLAAVWFKHQFPRAAIVAIEPSPSNYRILLRNLAGAPGFIAIQAAVWNRTTRVRIVDETADAWAFQVEECESVKGGDDISAQ